MEIHELVVEMKLLYPQILIVTKGGRSESSCEV